LEQFISRAAAFIMAVSIQNIVATTDLNCTLDLDFLSFSLPNYTYNQARFNGASYKLTDPKCCFQLFRTGKVVCLGSKSTEELLHNIRRLRRKLAELEYVVDIRNISIVNVVGSFNFGCQIDITGFTKEHRPHATYEPEIYPAAIYKKDDTPKLLIFHTGKLIIPGAKSIKALHDYFNVAHCMILPYLKNK